MSDGPNLAKPGDSGEQPHRSDRPPPPQPGWNRIPAGGAGVPPFAAPAPGYQVPYGYGTGGAPPFPKPSTNLVGAILATLLCCLPLGIVAIVFASQVDSKWSAGDWYGAKESSRKAQMWANISLGVGLLAILAYVALFAVSGGGSSSSY